MEITNKENIQLYVRVKPIKISQRRDRAFQKKRREENIGNDLDDVYSEHSDPEETLHVYDKNKILLRSTEINKSYQFKKVFDQDSTQLDVFENTAIPLIDHCLQGYHGVYFVYGQTGTGKTHSMGTIDLLNPYSEGIVPNTLKYLFQYTDENSTRFCKFRIHLSLYQVYMDQVQDLFNPENKSLTVREDKNDVYIEDLIEVHVKTMNQAITIINAGLAHRKMGAQGLNSSSSRSHTLLNIDIYQNMINNDHVQSVSSRLTLVDLAGSERVRKTKASGKRLKEAQSINSSLSALGNVILNLSKGEKFISFRESKLTRILQNSLKGESMIALLATVSSKEDDTHETLSTLQFANRCKQVLINPEDNVSIELFKDTPDKLMNSKIEEIESHYQKREVMLLSQIEDLEKKISTISNNSRLNQVAISYVDQQSTSSHSIGFKPDFDIEEITKAHPEMTTRKFKATIK